MVRALRLYRSGWGFESLWAYMIEKQHLHAVFGYMYETERCEASRPNRESGPRNFMSVGE